MCICGTFVEHSIHLSLSHLQIHFGAAIYQWIKAYASNLTMVKGQKPCPGDWEERGWGFSKVWIDARQGKHWVRDGIDLQHPAYWRWDEVWLPSKRQACINRIDKSREKYDMKLTADRRSGLRECWREWHNAMQLSTTELAQKLLQFSNSAVHHSGLRTCLRKWHSAVQLIKTKQRQAQRTCKLWCVLGELQDQYIKSLKTAFELWVQHFHGETCMHIESQVIQFLYVSDSNGQYQ